MLVEAGADIGAARMLPRSAPDELMRASPVPVLVCPSRR